MLKKWIAVILLGMMFLQGCETAKPRCVDAGQATSMCQPPSAWERNPLMRADKWIQDNLW